MTVATLPSFALLLHAGHGEPVLRDTPWHWFEPEHLPWTVAGIAVVVWAGVFLRDVSRRRRCAARRSG